MRYVEPQSDARTKLGGCFSHLLARALQADRRETFEAQAHRSRLQVRQTVQNRSYSTTLLRWLKRPIQQGRSNANRRGVPLRYVESESDARTKLGGCFSHLLDAPGARALDQIRLLLLELFHHQGDGFFGTFH